MSHSQLTDNHIQHVHKLTQEEICVALKLTSTLRLVLD
jgi:hypothetical protein